MSSHFLGSWRILVAVGSVAFLLVNEASGVVNGNFETGAKAPWTFHRTNLHNVAPLPGAAHARFGRWMATMPAAVGIRFIRQTFDCGDDATNFCQVTFDYVYRSANNCNGNTDAWVRLSNGVNTVTRRIILEGRHEGIRIAVNRCEPTTTIEFIIQDAGAVCGILSIDNVSSICQLIGNNDLDPADPDEVPSLPKPDDTTSFTVMSDCNRNGIDDFLDVADGATDDNCDGVPDSCLIESIPAMSEWGFIILALLLVTSGMVVLANRRRFKLT